MPEVMAIHFILQNSWTRYRTPWLSWHEDKAQHFGSKTAERVTSCRQSSWTRYRTPWPSWHPSWWAWHHHAWPRSPPPCCTRWTTPGGGSPSPRAGLRRTSTARRHWSPWSWRSSWWPPCPPPPPSPWPRGGAVPWRGLRSPWLSLAAACKRSWAATATRVLSCRHWQPSAQPLWCVYLVRAQLIECKYQLITYVNKLQ